MNIIIFFVDQLPVIILIKVDFRTGDTLLQIKHANINCEQYISYQKTGFKMCTKSITFHFWYSLIAYQNKNGFKILPHHA